MTDKFKCPICGSGRTKPLSIAKSLRERAAEERQVKGGGRDQQSVSSFAALR
jgi:hypothetical protein